MNNNNNKYFIRVNMLGRNEEVISFKDSLEMTINNVLRIMRERTRIYIDKLYLVDEYNNELPNLNEHVQCARTYTCKRKSNIILYGRPLPNENSKE